MGWIDTTDECEATGSLAELYARIAGRDGSVDNILKIHALNQPSLRSHYELYRTAMYGRSPLTRAQREMIAVVVSSENRCHY